MASAPTGRKPRSSTTAERTRRASESMPPANGDDARVRQRAYEIYESRAAIGEAGDAFSDWVQAEREVYGNA